jgi:hypothetical protein
MRLELVLTEYPEARQAQRALFLIWRLTVKFVERGLCLPLAYADIVGQIEPME